MYIQSPDTDVLVLTIRRYKQLCQNTNFITGVGNTKRVIPLAPIVDALGPAKVAALPGFHVFTGTDQIGRFAGKGKPSGWQALNKCSGEVMSAFTELGASQELTSTTEEAIEAFFVKCTNLEPTCIPLAISDGNSSQRSSWKGKSYHQHEVL